MATIKDNGEPLIDLKKYCPELFLDLDADRKRIEKSAFARKTVAKRLKRAISFLPHELTFKLTDAWRPQHIQEKYFRWYISFLSKRQPLWSKKRVINEVKKFVHPSTGTYASGHMTGAALDLALAYKKNGKRVPLRSNRLSFQENTLTRQPKLPKIIQANREIMFEALKKAGFINYPKEYWHWSYGDIRWAENSGNRRAIYGIKTKTLKK